MTILYKNWCKATEHSRCLVKMVILSVVISMSPAAAAEWEGVGPYEVLPLTLERDPHKTNIAYAGTYFGGLYKSVDSGFNWVLQDNPFSELRVSGIGFDPIDEGVFYVATFEGGVFRTLDDGVNWTAVNNGVTDLTIQEIAVDPFIPNHLMAATFSGVYRSQDRGNSWTLSNGSQGQLPVKTIVYHPGQKEVAFLGTLDNTGVYRTEDGGENWSKFNLGAFDVSIQKLRFDEQTGTLLYALSDQVAAYRLNSQATEWTRISDGLPPEPNNDILSHPFDNNVLFMANSKGVYISKNAGNTWYDSYLPEAALAQTFRLMADPISGVVHAANLSGPGLILSEDFGISWRPSLDRFQNMFVSAIAAVSAAGNTVVYAGSDRGVSQTSPLFTRDGRWEWSKPVNFMRTVFEVEVHPNQAGVVFAGTERAGVFKSSDWGINWTQLSDGIVPYTTHVFAQSPLPPHNIYAGTSSGFWTSKDLGASWEEHDELSTDEITALATAPKTPGYILIGTDDGRVYKSQDDGGTVTVWAAGLSGQGIRDLAIMADGTALCVTSDAAVYRRELADSAWVLVRQDVDNPAFTVRSDPINNTVAYLGSTGSGVHKTTDSGRTWDAVNTGIDQPEITHIAVRSDNPLEVYAASNQRVYRSLDGGGSWSGFSNGLPAGQIASLLPHAEAANVLFASIENQGLFWSADRGENWSRALSYNFIGGSTPLLQDVTNSANLFAGAQEFGVLKSPDHGASWTPSAAGISVFVRSIALDPSNDSVLYAGSLKDGVFKSVDGGNSWSHSGLAGVMVLDLEIDSQNPNTLLAATDQGVAKSLDGGVTWLLPQTPTRNGGGPTFVFSLEIDPIDSDIIYAATGESGLFKSIDGASNWTAINSGLGGLVRFLTLELDAGNPQRLYAGSDGGGVLVTENGGQNWNALNNGLINKTVTSLAIDPTQESVIYAGTKGGGVFRIEQNNN